MPYNFYAHSDKQIGGKDIEEWRTSIFPGKVYTQGFYEAGLYAACM